MSFPVLCEASSSTSIDMLGARIGGRRKGRLSGESVTGIRSRDKSCNAAQFQRPPRKFTSTALVIHLLEAFCYYRNGLVTGCAFCYVLEKRDFTNHIGEFTGLGLTRGSALSPENGLKHFGISNFSLGTRVPFFVRISLWMCLLGPTFIQDESLGRWSHGRCSSTIEQETKGSIA
jgi:hypothetical protein